MHYLKPDENTLLSMKPLTLVGDVQGETTSQNVNYQNAVSGISKNVRANHGSRRVHGIQEKSSQVPFPRDLISSCRRCCVNVNYKIFP